MTSTRIAVLIGALTCITSVPAASQSSTYWVDIVDPSELRALHSNKTHKGKGADGVSFVAHYRADGKALFVRANERIPRTWEIKGDDQVCYSDEKFPGCRRFQRGKANPAEFNVIHEAGWSALFRVEDGIPQF